MRSFILLLPVVILSACSSNTSTQSSNDEQYLWDNASKRANEIAEQCAADYKAKKIKTFYEANECQILGMERTTLPLFTRSELFIDYKTQRLLLALKVDKKQIGKEEANLLIGNLYDKMMTAQQAVVDQNRAQSQMAEQQRKSQAMMGFLGALQNTAKKYR